MDGGSGRPVAVGVGLDISHGEVTAAVTTAIERGGIPPPGR
jgi:hypothetical protein